MNSPVPPTPCGGSAPPRGQILASWNADPLPLILAAGASLLRRYVAEAKLHA